MVADGSVGSDFSVISSPIAELGSVTLPCLCLDRVCRCDLGTHSHEKSVNVDIDL